MKKRAYFTIAIFIYRILLDLIYKYQISPYWSYLGLRVNQTTVSIIISWIFLIVATVYISSFITSIKRESLTKNVLIFLFLFRFVPLTTFIGLKAQVSGLVVNEAIFWGLLFVLGKSFKMPKITYFKSNTVIIALITFALGATCIFISGYYAHFRMHLSFYDVYDLRMEARSFNIPKILNYLWSASKNILPILIIYFFQKKRYWIVLLLAIITLLNFGVNGQKATVLNLIICVALLLFYKETLINKIHYWLIGLSTCSLVEFFILKSSFIGTILIRRLCFIPNLLDEYFYDYTINHGAIYFHSVNGGPIAREIGKVYFNNIENNANNGLFSDAYVNLGILGTLIFPLLYICVFKYAEATMKYVPSYLSLFCSFVIAYAMLSSAFTTTFLSHGLILLIIFIHFIPKEDKSINPKLAVD